MFKITSRVLKNLWQGPATRRYPAEVRPFFPNTRGELVIDIEKCTFCGVCAVKCPSVCIVVDKKTAQWNYDPFACVYCGICVENCRFNALIQKDAYRAPSLERQLVKMTGMKKTERSPKKAERIVQTG